MKKLELIIEKNDGLLWGRIEGKGNFSPNGAGETTEALIEDVKGCIDDYKAHEGMEDLFWSKINTKDLEFDVRYDLESFLSEFDFLNLSVIADRIKINRTLLNQYKTGTKHPSLEQARKILSAIKLLANKIVEAQPV